MQLKILVLPLVMSIALVTGACERSPQADSASIPKETSEKVPKSEFTLEAPEANPTVPDTNSQIDITPEILDKFATALNNLQQIHRESETERVQAIENEGLSEEKFMSMSLALQHSNGEASSEFTDEEMLKMRRASTQVAEIMQETQIQIDRAILNEGLDPLKFNQILVQVEQDPQLAQQIQSKMRSN